jgi:uncharacterized protein with von Willebrand factor type A (vWA) domain
LPQIEKAIDSGVLDDEDLKDSLCKRAGVGHNQIHIGNILEIVRKIANTFSSREQAIFLIARKKEITERHAKKEEVLESVPFPDDEMSIKTISNPMEILKTIPTQYAFDDDIFMQKLVKNELLIRDYQSRRFRKQVLYMLIDASGSMAGSSEIYASGLAISIVRQAISEGATYFIRHFDERPHELHIVKTKKEAEEMINYLLRNPHSGGGTNIQNAILTAVGDITSSPDKFEKADILLISDGQDSVSLTKSDLKDIKLHTTMIDAGNRYKDNLKEVSTTYQDLSSSKLRVDF